MKPAPSSPRPNRRTTHVVRWAPAMLLAAALGATACGGATVTNVVAPPPPPDTGKTPPPPPPHAAFDLRFKGVGVLSSGASLEHSDINASSGSASLDQSFANASGTPLELGPGNCSTETCAWFEDAYALPATMDSLSVAYAGSIVSRLPDVFDTLATDTVITSLDVERSVGVYGLSEYITDTLGGYRMTPALVAAPDLAAAASADAAAGRVITAVSFDDDSVRYFSYGWSNAAGATYDTQVDAATIASIPTVAQALVDAGYVITAFGGTATHGFLLVGTRIHGSSAQHTLIVNAAPGTDLPGYAVVGYVVALDGAATVLYEK